MGVVSIALTIGICLAWLVPLVIGLKLLRGPQRTGGIVLTIIGIIWGIPSLAALALGVVYYGSMRSSFEIKDFNPATYYGATGVLQSSYRGPCKLLATPVGQKQTTRYASSSGDFVMPVGQYLLGSLEATAKGTDGKEWSARSTIPKQTIQVSPQAPSQLRAGPPYTAALKAQGSGKETRISMQLTDCCGNDVSLQRAGTNPPPPQFQIVDKSGRVLFTGKFAYG